MNRTGSRPGHGAKEVKTLSKPIWWGWKGTRAERFFRFAETYIHLPRSDGKLAVLLDWQKEFVRNYWSDNITSGALVVGRGAGKSSLIAMMATFNLVEQPTVGQIQVIVVAKSLEQVKQSVYEQIVAIIRAEPELDNRCLIYGGAGQEKILFKISGATLRPRAGVENTILGGDFTDQYLDEHGVAEITTWNAMLQSRKRKGARVLSAGTPGEDTESALYRIRTLVKEGKAPTDFFYKEFSGKAGASIHDEENWRLSEPSLDAGFPDIAFLRSSAILTPEELFRIFYLAEFDVVGFSSFLGSSAIRIWDGMEDNDYQLKPNVDTFIGIDVGIVSDCTSLVVTQRRSDNDKIHAVATIFTPKPNEIVDLQAVLAEIRALCATYRVKSISYDQHLFQFGAQQLFNEKYPMVQISQSVSSFTPIVQAMYEILMKDGLTHPKDEQFRNHIVAAKPKLNPLGFTLEKRKATQHIDSAVALALSLDRLLYAEKPLPKPVVLWA